MTTNASPGEEPQEQGPFDNSAHLSSSEKSQAEDHTAPQAVVIHEILLKEGETELSRASAATFWSGLAAGLSMGFSFLTQALIDAASPPADSHGLLASFGYCVGFVIVILGRQQLFTESTLTSVLPILDAPKASKVVALLRFWATVLSANLFGTIAFALLLNVPGLFDQQTNEVFGKIAIQAVSAPFWPTLVKAILAGWIIALMVWLLPTARSARLLVIVLLTYVVALGHFSHVIAGSVEAAYVVIAQQASVAQYIVGFFLPTVIGNTIGGVALVAILNHAPIASEIAD